MVLSLSFQLLLDLRTLLRAFRLKSEMGDSSDAERTYTAKEVKNFLVIERKNRDQDLDNQFKLIDAKFEEYYDSRFLSVKPWFFLFEETRY
jgi:hypothetical protein